MERKKINKKEQKTKLESAKLAAFDRETLVLRHAKYQLIQHLSFLYQLFNQACIYPVFRSQIAFIKRKWNSKRFFNALSAFNKFAHGFLI